MGGWEASAGGGRGRHWGACAACRAFSPGAAASAAATRRIACRIVEAGGRRPAARRPGGSGRGAWPRLATDSLPPPSPRPTTATLETRPAASRRPRAAQGERGHPPLKSGRRRRGAAAPGECARRARGARRLPATPRNGRRLSNIPTRPPHPPPTAATLHPSRAGPRCPGRRGGGGNHRRRARPEGRLAGGPPSRRCK
mgnify:CR=1 FL=1